MLPLPHFFASYKFMLSLTIALFFLITIFLLRSRVLPYKTNRYLTILLSPWYV
jgi:hypothetical protein